MQIAAQGIRVSLSGVAVLHDVEIAVQPGELLGLIGPNGAGKTTLLRVLARLQAADKGTLLYDKKTAATYGAQEMARRIAYLAQSETACWPLSVESIVALGRLPHRGRWGGVSMQDRRAIVDAMAMTEVSEFRDRPLATLSVGERMRVLLARALAVEAKVLLVDEPTSALDPYHQLQIMQLLQRQASAGQAIAAVLHDLTHAARFCDRLVLLKQGRVVAVGAPAVVLTDAILMDSYRISALRGVAEGNAFVLPWQSRQR